MEVARRRPRALIASVLTAWALAGCSGAPEESVLVSTDAIGNDMGTLISIADIRSATAEMVQSMNADHNLSLLRAQRSPLVVLLGELRQLTTITNFDKRLFRNQLLASLRLADRESAYRFLDSKPVMAERQRIEDATVRAPALPRIQGAELVLSGEVREILVRRPADNGGEIEKRTVQYSLSLTRVDDATVVWSHAHEVVKRQLIGMVYR